MLIIKLTRTQLLQQERKQKEEKQHQRMVKKLAKKPDSTKSSTIKKTAAKMTPKNMPQKKLSGGALKPKAKPGFRSTRGKKVLKANRSQEVPRKPRQSNGVKKVGVLKKTNNHGAKAKLTVGTKFKKVKASQKKSTGKKMVQKRQSRPKVVSRAAPKRNVTTSKPNTSKKLSQTRSKEPAGEAKTENRKGEKEAEKKPDCCCKQNSDGEDIQSCWMCRLSQRLGGKLIGNKTKLK